MTVLLAAEEESMSGVRIGTIHSAPAFASAVAPTEGGRNEASRNMRRRVIDRLSQIITVRDARQLDGVRALFRDLICFRYQSGPSHSSHSVWFPRKAVRRLKRKKILLFVTANTDEVPGFINPVAAIVETESSEHAWDP